MIDSGIAEAVGKHRTMQIKLLVRRALAHEGLGTCYRHLALDDAQVRLRFLANMTLLDLKWYCADGTSVL